MLESMGFDGVQSRLALKKYVKYLNKVKLDTHSQICIKSNYYFKIRRNLCCFITFIWLLGEAKKKSKQI